MPTYHMSTYICVPLYHYCAVTHAYMEQEILSVQLYRYPRNTKGAPCANSTTNTTDGRRQTALVMDKPSGRCVSKPSSRKRLRREPFCRPDDPLGRYPRSEIRDAHRETRRTSPCAHTNIASNRWALQQWNSSGAFYSPKTLFADPRLSLLSTPICRPEYLLRWGSESLLPCFSVECDVSRG